MCELFGFTSDHSVNLTSYLKEFYSHSDAHPHGWGYASITENDVKITRNPGKASESEVLRDRLSSDICEKTALAHIRYATIGNVEYTNCHPFTGKTRRGRQITLIHNGTIFEYPELQQYVKIQTGDTDSERILLHFIHLINDCEKESGEEASAEVRFRIFADEIGKLAIRNKLNLIFFDGELLYVHTNCRGTLHRMIRDNSAVIATSPLTDEGWKEVPFARLIAYREGKEVFTGEEHGNEYIPNEDDIKYIYQAFSYL